MVGGIYNAQVVTFDRPSPRGQPFVQSYARMARQEILQRPWPGLEVKGQERKPFGYQETLTTLGSYWRNVPPWAIDGPPVSRPLAPNMVLPMPTQRVTAARAAFAQAMGVSS